MKSTLVEGLTYRDLVVFCYTESIYFRCRFVIRPFIHCCVELCSRVPLENLFTTYDTYEQLTDRIQ